MYMNAELQCCWLKADRGGGAVCASASSPLTNTAAVGGTRGSVAGAADDAEPGTTSGR